MQNDDQATGCLDSVDVDRIIPALPFMPSIGETVLSPSDGILTIVAQVLPVRGTEDRYVVSGRAVGRKRTSHKRDAGTHRDTTAWMFRLVETPATAVEQTEDREAVAP